MNIAKDKFYLSTNVDHKLRLMYGIMIEDYLFLDFIRCSNEKGKKNFNNTEFLLYAGIPVANVKHCFDTCKSLKLVESNKTEIITTELWNRHFVTTDIVPDVIQCLNDVTGSSYKANSKAAIKYIRARIKEGFTLDEFKVVIYSRANEWGADDNMKQYLRPETLFGTKFESYLQFAKSVATNKITPGKNKMVM